MHCTTSSQVLLKSTVATIQSNSDVSMDANILFDEWAQCPFLTEDIAKQLTLKTTESFGG